MKLRLMSMFAATMLVAGTAYAAADCCKEDAPCCKEHKDCCKHDHDKPAPKEGDHKDHHQHHG